MNQMILIMILLKIIIELAKNDVNGLIEEI